MTTCVVSVSERKRVFYLIAVLAAVGFVATSATIVVLYEAAYRQTARWLAETVESQARLIESVARFDARYGRYRDPAADTLFQIRDALESSAGLGETGEFIVARREGDDIHFLFHQRHAQSPLPATAPLAGTAFEPMRRALAGESGTMTVRDDRGVWTLVAYEPIKEIGLGMVAKIDLTEIRAPFLRAFLIATIFAFLAVALGAVSFLRIADPMIRRSRENERTLGTLMQNMPGMVYRCRRGSEWTTEFVSAGSLELTGHAPAELAGRRGWTPQDLIHPDERKAAWNEILTAARAGRPHQMSYRMTTPAGAQKWVLENGRGVLGPDGELEALEGFMTDVTARKSARADMAKLSSAVQQTADAVVITDRYGVIEYVNPAFEAVTGYRREEAVGRKSNLARSGEHDENFYRRLWDTIQRGEVFRDVVINRRKNGELYHEEKTITPVRGELGEITHFISTGKDITERMRTQERLHHLAHHDTLTGLPNRAYFSERLNGAIAHAQRRRRPLAVLFLDLDRFKIINDTLGHDVGDQSLQILAARLKSCVREGDTVARLGGDEFTVLLEDLASADDIPLVAQKFIHAVLQPFVLERREFFITTSIGVALYPNDGEDSITLLKNADTAMYRAKEAGRNNFQFYSAELSAKAFERLALETSLRRALERQEFELYYQPLVDLKTQRVFGAEALLRWHHPDFSLVSPAQFISVAEETGLIVPIGEWVLRSACAQAQAWRAAGAKLSVTVNLSGRQFNQPGLADTIARALRESGLDPGLLELEITEGVLMQNAQATIDTLQALHGMGLRIAIDDFGTGHSSLSYLKRFPIDTLKIDQTFVRDVTSDPNDASIVTAIIAMARSMGLRVVAEGVETEGQLVFLHSHRCDGAQGYLFCRPLPALEVTPLVLAGRCGRGAVL